MYSLYQTAIRVEWTHARASRDRWHEEVRLLRAESRRATKSFAWMATIWSDRKESLTVAGIDTKGILGFTDRQVQVFLSLETQAKIYNTLVEDLAKIWDL